LEGKEDEVKFRNTLSQENLSYYRSSNKHLWILCYTYIRKNLLQKTKEKLFVKIVKEQKYLEEENE